MEIQFGGAKSWGFSKNKQTNPLVLIGLFIFHEQRAINLGGER
jgi:hypothetical protein